VKRRHRMWSWPVIKEHRDLCKKYRDLYKTKLVTKKPSTQLLADLEVCVFHQVFTTTGNQLSEDVLE